MKVRMSQRTSKRRSAGDEFAQVRLLKFPIVFFSTAQLGVTFIMATPSTSCQISDCFSPFLNLGEFIMATPNLVPRASSLLDRFKCREKKPWGRGWATPSTSCQISDCFSLLPNSGWPYNGHPNYVLSNLSIVFPHCPTRGDFIMATPSTAWQIFDGFSLLPNSGWFIMTTPSTAWQIFDGFSLLPNSGWLYYGHPKYGMTNLRLFFTIGQPRS